MKKLIFLLLVFGMAVGLCACGSKDGFVENKTIYLDESITIGDYEITVTDTEFVDNWNPNGDCEELCGNGNVHFIVHYTVKNIGKSDVIVPYKMFKLNYNNGYEFKEDNYRTYYYSFDTSSFVFHENELSPLSKAKPCQTCIEVPVEVKDNIDAPLKLEITVDNKTYVYNIRPADEKQQEIFYNKGMDLLNKKDYKTAIRMFENAGEFSDAKEKYHEVAILYYIEAPYHGDAPEYFSAHRDSYELISGEDIKSFIVGEWNHSDSDEVVVFKEDGTIDNQYITGGLWKVNGNMIKISDNVNMTPDTYEVRKVKDGIYLFFRDGDSPSFSLSSIE